MKLLLPSNTNTFSGDRVQKGTSRMEEVEEDDAFRLSSYLHKSSGCIDKDNFTEEHSYGRAATWRPDLIFAKPLNTLFVHAPDGAVTREDDEIDVESVPKTLAPVYDTNKAINLMDKCERHVNFQHPDEGNPDWEDHIPRINWTSVQSRLFNKVVRALHNDQLARLAQKDSPNEPVLRRVTVDKTARRMRQALASVAWNTKYTQWLHNTLIDNLPASYLTSYLDAVQTLKAKVPSLVERMLAGNSTRSTLTSVSDLVNIVHKRPWDPLSSGIIPYKQKKLPRDPILVMVPSGPGSGSSSNSRTHHWMANLSAMGTVVCVYSSPGRVVGKTSVANCLDHMLAATRAKVAELHADYGDKPVVLVGIGSGATLACQVALVENVTAVVCLGFPLYTVEGERGTPDDALLNIPVPVLFVIGQNASTCSVDDIEDMREKLNVVTSLVMVGGGDDQLRLTKAKKKLDGVTQTMVDKCIMDEVADFLGTLLMPDYVPPTRPVVVHPIEPPPNKRSFAKTERKRKADALLSNNPDQLGIPPPAKKGRKPKISMMQKMVQNKWAQQMPEVSRQPVSIAASPIQLSMETKHIVMDNKSLQSSAQNQVLGSDSTITVVAASSPTITASAVKNRLASGQLTSLSSLLQPGSRSISVGGEDKFINVRTLSSATPNITEEFNILDMPVILGDQNPDETLLPAPAPAPTTSPVKFILTNPNTKGLSTIKYLNQAQQPVKCTKIYISKTSDGGERKTVYLGDLDSAGTSRSKPRIRHIPATKHSQFY